MPSVQASASAPKAAALGASFVSPAPTRVLDGAAAVSALNASGPAAVVSSAPALAQPAAVLTQAAGGKGTLKLAINPWGEVLVDGHSMGVAPPLNQLTLPPGEHVITIRNGDAPDFRQTVVVRADKVVHVKHQF